MEIEEKLSPVIDSPDESNAKKEKIITLLFPPESQPPDGKENKKDKNKPPTKVVIRRLPPRYTKEAFIEDFSPLPAHDYFHFVRGDLNLGIHAFSRAYINFLNQEEIFSFKEKYDDYDLQDDKGRTYHAVVEFAAFQKIPKRNVVKKKLSKAGTLESDPKYIEFLQKLKESKNFISNPSEYFHETDNSLLKTKIVTTPLLEFLKKKRQKKIDLRNEIRQRKREAERDKKRKEEEKRKADREKRKEEKKNPDKSKPAGDKRERLDDKFKDKKNDDKIHLKEEKKDSKSRKSLDKNSVSEERLYNSIPNDPAILEVVVRRSDKESKPAIKSISKENDEMKATKTAESDTNVGKFEKKPSDYRTRIAEEKQRKTFYKRDLDESKVVKTGGGNRKGIPDEKGDNYNIGNCGKPKETLKKLESESDSKRNELKIDMKETKSKFRYSEQRNRDREYRRKTSDVKNLKDAVQASNSEAKGKFKESDEKRAGVKSCGPGQKEMTKSNSEPHMSEGNGRASSAVGDADVPSSALTGRRKSLEMERELPDTERKRSKSFHDIRSKELMMGCDGREKKEKIRQSGEKEVAEYGEDVEKERADEESKRDPRAERRIRNKRMHPNCNCHPTCTYVKDRPSIEIYRPGMGKFSKQRLENNKKEDSNSTSPTGIPHSKQTTRFSYKANNSSNSNGRKSGGVSEGRDGVFCKGGSEGNGKHQSEMRTMTFGRSDSREN